MSVPVTVRDLSSNWVVNVAAKDAKKLRLKLEAQHLLTKGKKLQRIDDNRVLIPIDNENCDLDVIEKIIEHFAGAFVKKCTSDLVFRDTHLTPYQVLYRDISCLLKEHNLDQDLLSEVPRRWERHGDLVILPATAFASLQWTGLGILLWRCVVSALSCKRLATYKPVADDCFRSSQVTLVLGENGVVEHVDNAIRYSYDVTKCMFSVGNITEKLRIAKLDCRNETVVDLYAGIGYFTLPYLVHAKAKHVHACEWNPDAVFSLKKNLLINGVSDYCTVHEGDNRQLELLNIADRINMGLIPSSEASWPSAVKMLKSSGGHLHVHGNVTWFTNDGVSPYLDELPFTEDNQCEKYTDKQEANESKYLCSHRQNCDINSPDNFVFVDSNKTGKEQLQECCNKFGQSVVLKFKHLFKNHYGQSWNITLEHVEKVKSYAPHIEHVVVDLFCLPDVLK